MRHPLPDGDLIRALLGYNPDTGAIWWKVARSNVVRAGVPITRVSPTTGYIGVTLEKRLLSAHRLAWFLHYGEWPKNYIDHINHKKTDNRISNLRDVEPSVNGLNRAGAQRNKALGRKLGAFFDTRSGVWYAQLRFKHKTRTFGPFATQDEAHQTYITERAALLQGVSNG